MKKIKKGNYGYIAHQKKMEILKTAAMFGISLALFLIGYLTTKTKGNLLTVVAVLGCLPASKSAVNMIMFLKARGCSIDAKQQIELHMANLYGLYDLYFTSYDKNFSISHLIVTNNSVIAYTENGKIDTAAFEAHIKKMLGQERITDFTVKLFTDQKKYLQRLDEIAASQGDKKAPDTVLNLLLSISL